MAVNLCGLALPLSPTEAHEGLNLAFYPEMRVAVFYGSCFLSQSGVGV